MFYVSIGRDLGASMLAPRRGCGHVFRYLRRLLRPHGTANVDLVVASAKTYMYQYNLIETREVIVKVTSINEVIDRVSDPIVRPSGRNDRVVHRFAMQMDSVNWYTYVDSPNLNEARAFVWLDAVDQLSTKSFKADGISILDELAMTYEEATEEDFDYGEDGNDSGPTMDYLDFKGRRVSPFEKSKRSYLVRRQ